MKHTRRRGQGGTEKRADILKAHQSKPSPCVSPQCEPMSLGKRKGPGCSEILTPPLPNRKVGGDLQGDRGNEETHRRWHPGGQLKNMPSAWEAPAIGDSISWIDLHDPLTKNKTPWTIYILSIYYLLGNPECYYLTYVGIEYFYTFDMRLCSWKLIIYLPVPIVGNLQKLMCIPSLWHVLLLNPVSSSAVTVSHSRHLRMQTKMSL